MRRLALTKNDLARVIIQALYKMPKLPPADHPKVLNMAKRKKVDLITPHRNAVKIIQCEMRV